MEWDIDLHEVDGLRRWYGRQPRLVRKACGHMLNDFAFGTRTEAIKQINRTMTVRNDKFVSSRVRVTKTSITKPVNAQQSMTGSLAKERFSGWVEQEFGTATKRNRFATTAGRGGSPDKQMRHIIRLKPKHEMISPDDPEYNQRGGSQNISGFLSIAARKMEKRLIRIGNTVYKRKRKKFIPVQKFKRKQPKQKKWLLPARKKYFRKTDLDRQWRNTVKRVMRPPGKV